MDINRYWFPIDNERTDITNVVGFIEGLPSNLEVIFSANTSNFKDTYFKEENILTFDMFLLAFKESVDILKEISIPLSRMIKIINLAGINDTNYLTEELKQIGFTDKSLIFKAKRLNILWEDIAKTAERAGSAIIDFTNNEIVKLLRKFLQYLNSILGSLAKVFTSLDPIKEFKEIIESYIAIGDE